MKFFTLSIITGFILWPGIGATELYTWTDEEGNLHITDVLPPELQKKSAPNVKPDPRSVRPMKATSTMTELSRSAVPLAPEPPITPHLPKELTVQPKMEGLVPSQATLTSDWQTFKDAQPVAKVPVQRWKDKRGIEHFADVLPTAKTEAEVGAISSTHRPKTP